MTPAELPADEVWAHWRDQWTIPPEVTYFNHGSFGPSPRSVQQAREQWTSRLESQPMDFFVHRMEEHLDTARARLGNWIGARPQNLVFVENATYGMNVVAASLELKPGDQVLLTDHEYGAVLRLWRKVCRKVGAETVVQPIGEDFTAEGAREQIVERLFEGVTERTRLIVASHVTSPTAVTLPVEAICRRARYARIPVCIDGPHALATCPLRLDRLDCDYYTSSGHKWLSAPFGTGFLYVAPRRQQQIKPVVVSWGGRTTHRPPRWQDEFQWHGTHDPAGFLAVPAAIDFLESCGVRNFRQRTHQLAQYAREKITGLTGIPALLPDDSEWYGPMIALPLPDSTEGVPDSGVPDPLQTRLRERYRIEVPIIHRKGRRFVRVSCHLYTQRADIDRLVDALDQE